MPNLDSAAEIPECFEEQERVAAFAKLCEEEQLLKKVIDCFVYTGEEPLTDPSKSL